jgi:hypothetical protein
LAAIVGVLLISVFFSGCTARKEYNTTSLTNQIFNEIEGIENLSNSSTQNLPLQGGYERYGKYHITECGTIDKPGTYILDGDIIDNRPSCLLNKVNGSVILTCTNQCLSIESDNVEILCIGHSIISNISNGTYWGDIPISGSKLSNLHIAGCKIYGGTALQFSGLKDSVIEFNDVYSRDGISLGTSRNVTIQFNNISYNFAEVGSIGEGLVLYNSYNNTIKDNEFLNVDVAIVNDTGSSFISNKMHNNTFQLGPAWPKNPSVYLINNTIVSMNRFYNVTFYLKWANNVFFSYNKLTNSTVYNIKNVFYCPDQGLKDGGGNQCTGNMGSSFCGVKCNPLKED